MNKAIKDFFKIEKTLIVFILANFLTAIFVFGVDVELGAGGDNSMPLIVKLLVAIYVNLLALSFEIFYKFRDRLNEQITLEKEIFRFLSSLNKSKEIKYEVAKVIENISEVYDDKINYPPDTQEYVRTLFKDQARSTIQSVNESLKNFKSGEIFLSGIASLEATKKCMEMVKKEVFAISYPDINFWGGDGMVYFKINKQAVIERGVNIHRFFVIRNTSEDQRVFNDAFSKAEFKKVLLMHLDANKEADQGQFNVYITHDQLVNFRNIKPNLKKIPDISLYDSCISSEWLERAIIVGEEERVDESRVSIKREDLTLAIRIQNYFLNYSDTISIRIQSEDDVENCLERIQTLIQKKKN